MAIRLVSIHGFDPRGPKVGGIETHVRHLLRRHPSDMRVLMVGIDGIGDLELGRMYQITVSGREIDFVPVLHIPEGEQTGAARSLGESTTLRFAAAVLRHLPALRRMIRGEAAAVEIERYEYAPVARMLGCPTVMVIHNEGDPRRDTMDSIMTRYWYVNSIAERIALCLSSRVFGVTPGIAKRIKEQYPSQSAKTDVLTVSVDTDMFRAAPFDLASGKLKLVYAGRLDTFKDPATMFRVIAALYEHLDGAFEFHYCGSADPHRYAEFSAIEPFTVRHGALSSEGVAQVMGACHMGILVSLFEGMPCFLLELLATGRPLGGIRLPQFDPVVEQGVSGRVVERADTPEETERRVVDAILALWSDIQADRIDPHVVHEHIVPWSVDNQMGRLFKAIHDVARPGRTPSQATANAAAR